MHRRLDSLNFKKEAAALQDYWYPRILARVNDQYVKVAKLKGDLVSCLIN